MVEMIKGRGGCDDDDDIRSSGRSVRTTSATVAVELARRLRWGGPIRSVAAGNRYISVEIITINTTMLASNPTDLRRGGRTRWWQLR